MSVMARGKVKVRLAQLILTTPNEPFSTLADLTRQATFHEMCPSLRSGNPTAVVIDLTRFGAPEGGW
jgi:hypothetical protein